MKPSHKERWAEFSSEYLAERAADLQRDTKRRQKQAALMQGCVDSMRKELRRRKREAKA